MRLDSYSIKNKIKKVDTQRIAKLFSGIISKKSPNFTKVLFFKSCDAGTLCQLTVVKTYIISFPLPLQTSYYIVYQCARMVALAATLFSWWFISCDAFIFMMSTVMLQIAMFYLWDDIVLLRQVCCLLLVFWLAAHTITSHITWFPSLVMTFFLYFYKL